MNKKGLTLIELMITSATMIVLVGVSLIIYITILKSWRNQEVRAGISITLNRAVEEVVRDLREAKDIYSPYDGEIAFSHDLADYYAYYLYDTSDSHPPAFDQSSYVLKRVYMSGGSFAYGTGRTIITGVVPRRQRTCLMTIILPL
ncbi:MAG: hypothetical protein WBC16_04540 [Candidatus Omnitrophota bacterium]